MTLVVALPSNKAEIAASRILILPVNT